MDENEIDIDVDAEEVPKPVKKQASVTVVLREPVKFGKDEVIEQLVIKPTARAFKDFTLPMKADGTVMYQPYALAEVGMKLAGHPAAVVNKLSIADMSEVAQVVLGFLN